uniref:Uncharacterized protein n=2 Tax=Ursus TaxID=9639 RepID=A0A452VHK4_URSMA
GWWLWLPKVNVLNVTERTLYHNLKSPVGLGQPPFLGIQGSDVGLCRNEQGRSLCK